MKVNAVRFVLSFLACGTVIPPRWVVAEPTDSSGEVGFPPLLDPDDVAYFFANDDLDGLHWALTNVFQRSLRNPNATRRGGEQLPATLVARGGGSTYTTAYKLQHDLEQALYLAETLADPEQAYFFQHTVVPKYREVLDRIPPLEFLTRTGGLYPFSQTMSTRSDPSTTKPGTKPTSMNPFRWMPKAGRNPSSIPIYN
jgi:hypothetical protein